MTSLSFLSHYSSYRWTKYNILSSEKYRWRTSLISKTAKKKVHTEKTTWFFTLPAGWYSAVVPWMSVRRVESSLRLIRRTDWIPHLTSAWFMNQTVWATDSTISLVPLSLSFILLFPFSRLLQLRTGVHPQCITTISFTDDPNMNKIQYIPEGYLDVSPTNMQPRVSYIWLKSYANNIFLIETFFFMW